MKRWIDVSAVAIAVTISLAATNTSLRATQTPAVQEGLDEKLENHSAVGARGRGTSFAILAGAGALAIPLDESIRGWFQGSGVQGSGFAGHTSDALSVLGGHGPIIAGGITYLAARLSDREALADVAVHTTESMAVALGSTMVVKALVGRQRPYAGYGHLSFEPGDGTETRDLRSFPSGHATTVFALVAGVTAEARHWWPEYSGTVARVLYPVAGLTAISRVFHDQHWTSDVLVGAGVGVFIASWWSGRAHSEPASDQGLRVDVSPLGAGSAAVSLVRAPRW